MKKNRFKDNTYYRISTIEFEYIIYITKDGWNIKLLYFTDPNKHSELYRDSRYCFSRKSFFQLTEFIKLHNCAVEEMGESDAILELL